MALKLADRCKETTTTTGKGTYNLAGAAAGFRTLIAGVANGNTCHYIVTDDVDYEIGVGTVTDATPDTLSRNTIFASSNGGAAVNWGSGTRNVFVGLSGAGLESLLDDAVTGIAVQTAARTWVRRSLTSAGAITITNANGVGGAPLLTLDEGTGNGLDADTVDGDHSPKIVPGLQMVFHESTAPTGWTQQSLNDQVLVVTNGAGTGTGGSASIVGGTLTSGANSATHTHAGGTHQHGFSGTGDTAGTSTNTSAESGSSAPNLVTNLHIHGVTITGDTQNPTSNNTGTNSVVHTHSSEYNLKHRFVMICDKD